MFDVANKVINILKRYILHAGYKVYRINGFVIYMRALVDTIALF